MLLSIFVITQIALDIAIVGYLLTNGRRRKAAVPARRAQPRTAPPSWYQDFLATAEDLMVLVEPVLDLAESGGLAPPPRVPIQRLPPRSSKSARTSSLRKPPGSRLRCERWVNSPLSRFQRRRPRSRVA